MENPSGRSVGDEAHNPFSGLSLRLLDLSDVDDLMVWATDEEVNRFSSWEECLPSREAALAYVLDFVIPHPWFRAICRDDRAIGIVSVTPNQGRDRCRAEIGYVVASQYWGQGIATWAVSTAATTVFVEWPHLERLEGLADVENVASQRVLEKAGFQREGVLRKHTLLNGRARDMVVFSLLPTDPQVNYLF